MVCTEVGDLIQLSMYQLDAGRYANGGADGEKMVGKAEEVSLP